MTPAQDLLELLKSDETWFIPGVFDSLSAILAQRAGFRFAFISGYGIAASRLGYPDVGLISGSEMTDSIRNICTAARGLPMIADGDQGYGNAMNVRRTIHDYASAGAAVIMIEDQINPKRCGHFGQKQVITREEAKLKIRAAVDARREFALDILISARTDALATHGFDEALARIHDFEKEGADILFIEALENEQQMRTFCNSVTKPTWGNNFEGGRTPYLPRTQLIDIGFRIVTDPTLLFSAVRVMQTHLRALAENRDQDIPDRTSFREMAEILRFPEYSVASDRYKT